MKNEFYHATLQPQGNRNASNRTLDRLKTRKRDVLIYSGPAFNGNLKESFKFGPRYVKENQLN